MLRFAVIGTLVCWAGMAVANGNLLTRSNDGPRQMDQRVYQACDPRYNAC